MAGLLLTWLPSLLRDRFRYYVPPAFELLTMVLIVDTAGAATIAWLGYAYLERPAIDSFIERWIPARAGCIPSITFRSRLK